MTKEEIEKEGKEFFALLWCGDCILGMMNPNGGKIYRDVVSLKHLYSISLR